MSTVRLRSSAIVFVPSRAPVYQRESLKLFCSYISGWQIIFVIQRIVACVSPEARQVFFECEKTRTRSLWRAGSHTASKYDQKQRKTVKLIPERTGFAIADSYLRNLLQTQLTPTKVLKTTPKPPFENVMKQIVSNSRRRKQMSESFGRRTLTIGKNSVSFSFIK